MDQEWYVPVYAVDYLPPLLPLARYRLVYELPRLAVAIPLPRVPPVPRVRDDYALGLVLPEEQWV